MTSIFINGLLKQDLDATAVQMAMWENLSIWKVSYKKVSSFFSEHDEISKMIEDERKKYIADHSDPLVPSNLQKDPEELDSKLLKSICDHLAISTREIKSIGDLDDLGIEIETKVIELQKKITKNEFNGDSIPDLIKYNMEKMFENLKDEFEKKSKEEQEKIVTKVLDVIKEMPDEQKELLRSELKVDSISQDAISKAIVTGSLGIAFAAVIEIAGFSAYIFAAEALAAIVGVVGITLPFAAYTSLASYIAFLANPFLIIPSALILGVFMTKRANKKIRDSLLPTIITQASISSTKDSEANTKAEKIIKYLELLNQETEDEEETNEQSVNADETVDNPAIQSNEEILFLNLGIEKIKSADYIGSIQDLNKSIEIKPDHAEAYYQRGFAKTKLEDFRGSIQDYNKSIEFNPKCAEAYYQRGLAKINLKQRDEGCLDLSKSGELGYSEAYIAIKDNCN